MGTSREIIGYLRVSTERQAGEAHTSMSDQEAAISGLAETLGSPVSKWFRDAGASGATVSGRPAFQEILAWCEANPRAKESPGYVLALNDSRFGRFPEPDEATYWRHHLSTFGWIVRFAEGDDVQGDFRSVVRAIGSVEASGYRRTLVANTRRGMKGAASLGYWTREAPYGYRRMVVFPEGSSRVLAIGQPKATNEKVRLTPEPDEARVVRWAFEAYAAGGETLGSMVRALKTEAPGRRWSRTAVGAMLKNPAYRGDVVGGGGSYGCEDAHEAIVPGTLFHAVQRRLSRNATMGKGVRSHYLLSGLLACPYCGEAYTGGGGGRSRTKDPERTHRRFYRDAGGVSGACPGRIGTVMRHIVDDAVVELVAEVLASPAAQASMVRMVDEALDAASGSIGDREATLKASRGRLLQKRDRIVAAVGDGVILSDEAAPQLEVLRGSVADIDANLQALRFARGRAVGVKAERDRILKAAAGFGEMAKALEGPELREFVAPWLGSVTFDKVSRELAVGVRVVPATPSLFLVGSPGRSELEQGCLIERRRSLVQPGHEGRVVEGRRLRVVGS